MTTPTAHARFSPSASSRWLKCPGSIQAEERIKSEAGYVEETNEAAERGTRAHDLASTCLLTRSQPDDHDHDLDDSLVGMVDDYLEYVREREAEDTITMIEKQVRFDADRPGECFGTLDCCIINHNKKTVHVIDLKTGRHPVHATLNTQLVIYALGVYASPWKIDRDYEFHLHIVQPSIANNSCWVVPASYLETAGAWIKGRMDLARQDNPPLVPGPVQCKFCSARTSCPARSGKVQNDLKPAYQMLDKVESTGDVRTVAASMSDDYKKRILDNRDLIRRFIDDIETDVINRLINGGEFPGYKLVRSQSRRRWAKGAEDGLKKKLGAKAYEPKLITLTKAEKLLGKGAVDDLTVKPEGKADLVPDSDRRSRLITHDDVRSSFEALG